MQLVKEVCTVGDRTHIHNHAVQDNMNVQANRLENPLLWTTQSASSSKATMIE